MPRGGRRPGAGAPFGNLNAVKHGKYSPRVNDGLLLMGAMPELFKLFRSLKHTDARRNRLTFFKAIAAAYKYGAKDPELAKAMENTILDHIMPKLEPKDWNLPATKKRRKQSFNQKSAATRPRYGPSVLDVLPPIEYL